MRVIILDDAEQVAEKGASFFLQQLKRKPDSIFGLATGSSPVALYKRLIDAHKQQGVSFSKVRTFNLDEYLGLSGGHNQSYRYFMQQCLFNHLDIAPEATHVPDGATLDPVNACREYEQRIAECGGIDIQLLGIGRNGHIGFNEPSSSLASRTRIKTLTKETIEDNARFFSIGETQPTLSLTMGIGTIMDATQVVLIATGDSKAQAVKDTIEGSVSASCPASMLQLHPNAVIVLDVDAASSLREIEFYQFVEEQRQKLTDLKSA